jgi:trk system potassium uptake protein TrkH
MLRGRPEEIAFGRVVPVIVIYRALALAFAYVLVVFTLAAVLAARNDFSFVSLLFEAASATGTVGLSAGVTSTIDQASQAAVIVVMLLGRFGPLLLVLYMTKPRRAVRYRMREEGIRLG